MAFGKVRADGGDVAAPDARETSVRGRDSGGEGARELVEVRARAGALQNGARRSVRSVGRRFRAASTSSWVGLGGARDLADRGRSGVRWPGDFSRSDRVSSGAKWKILEQGGCFVTSNLRNCLFITTSFICAL